MTHRVVWLITAAAGVVGASVVFASPFVHLDSLGEHKKRSEEVLPISSSATSHFSYSYYESHESGHDAGANARSSYLLQKTHLPGTHTGIHRYDTAQISSNITPEGNHAEAVLPYPAGYWGIFAVLDGRNGRSTSRWLRENIVYAVGGALVDLYSRLYEAIRTPSDRPPTPSADDIERTLKDTFKRLDNDIVYGSVDNALSSASRPDAEALSRAYSGSSALLGFYDSHSEGLHVALTGDARAVLGRRTQKQNGDVVYQVHVLTVEQDGANLAEEYRLNARHPGEAVVYDGRVLHGGPTRSFGDALYKWDRDTQKRLEEASVGEPVPSHVKTPPYLTAEPEVTSTSVRPGDFLILGTRGLWDRLTSEEAVGLIGMWLDDQWRQQGEHARAKPTMSVNDYLVSPLVVETQPSRIEDHNAATHLLRNAVIRGSNGDSGAGDNLTATVVFFASADERNLSSNRSAD